MVLLDYLLIPSVAFLFTGLAMHSFVPDVPAWVFSGAAVVVATLLNVSGARVLARAAIAVVVAETVVLAAVLVGAVGVLLRDGATVSWHAPLTGVGSFSLAAVVGAVSVAALAFLGFDAIATFAEESAGAPRLIGRAMVACLLAAGVLFLLQTYLMALITPASPAALAADPSLQGTTFYDVTREQIAPWLATTLGVSKALGATFAGMVGVAAGSRIVMTMAREGRLPAVLGRVSERGGVPALATTGITAVTLALAVWAAHEPTGLDLLASTVSLGALSAFVLLHASVVAYYVVRRGSRRWLPHLAVPVAGAAALVAIILYADHKAQTVAAVWLVLGLLLALARRRSVVPSTTEGVHHG
jgi:amino acid transporter